MRELTSNVVDSVHYDDEMEIPLFFVELTGSWNGALFLNQLIDWQSRATTDDGFFLKTYEEIWRATRLSEYQAARLSRKFRASHWLETTIRLSGGTRYLYYRLNLDALLASIERFQERQEAL